MKSFLKLLIASLFVLSFMNSCEKDVAYDIDWAVPEITSVSSYNSPLSSTITLSGTFDQVNKVSIGTANASFEVGSDKMSMDVVVPRNTPVLGGAILVSNEYRQSFTTSEMFIPIIPLTTVSDVSDIQVGITFSVEGTNVDLLQEVHVNGVAAAIVSRAEGKIIVSVAGLDLSAGMLVDVDFISLAKNTIPTAEKIEVVYPKIEYTELDIINFTSDTYNDTSGETSSTGVVNETVALSSGQIIAESYWKLRGTGFGWSKETGNIASTEVPDLGTFVSPYLTFAVRTPSGSAGYFQFANSQGQWRHFGYGFDTGGEWMIISQPVDENWEGGSFDTSNFIPKLEFKAGNAGTSQDLDIAFVKITEGPYDGSQQIGDLMGGSDKPEKIALMDFEDASSWPDILNGSNVIGSVNTSDSYQGNNSFTFKGDGSLGNWGGYWGSTLGLDGSSIDFSAFDNPYLSFAAKTIDQDQYFIIRIFGYQGDHHYGSAVEAAYKFFPNTSGEWETFQISLLNDSFENWNGYAGLKSFVDDIPVHIQRIEIIASRYDGNDVEFTIDEVLITDGARF